MIREACRRYYVREIVCDPFRWARSIQALEEEGLPVAGVSAVAGADDARDAAVL
ncbi:MAG: hypothetical protein ACM4D3_02025 [Candidatus Sericytochromatia bacterium]